MGILGFTLKLSWPKGLREGGRVRKWDRLSFSCVSLRSLSFRGLTIEALQVLKMYCKAWGKSDGIIHNTMISEKSHFLMSHIFW